MAFQIVVKTPGKDPKKPKTTKVGPLFEVVDAAWEALPEFEVTAKAANPEARYVHVTVGNRQGRECFPLCFPRNYPKDHRPGPVTNSPPMELLPF